MPNIARAATQVIEHWRSAVMLVVLILVAVTIARSYFGESSSPYGVCYAASGRPVPCDAIGR